MTRGTKSSGSGGGSGDKDGEDEEVKSIDEQWGEGKNQSR